MSVSAANRNRRAREPDLFRDAGEGDDFFKRARDAALLAGDKDARGNDGRLVLVAQDLFLVDALEEHLCRVDDALGEADRLAHGRNLSERVLQISTGPTLLVLGDSLRRHLEGACDSGVVVLERDDGRELVGGVEERVGGTSDSRRVVALGIGKGTPCTTRAEGGR